MIGLIKGKLAQKDESVIIVVGGIGFELVTTETVKLNLPDIGDECLLYTCVKYQRDDLPQLYAFLKKEEKDVFKLLVSVSGVGPKSTLALLDMYTPSQIAEAIVKGDANALSAVSGLGEKSAKRIIVDLKDSVRKLEIEDDGILIKGEFADAVSALNALGWPTPVARRVVSDVLKENSSLNEIQTIIKAALQKLGKTK